MEKETTVRGLIGHWSKFLSIISFVLRNWKKERIMLVLAFTTICEEHLNIRVVRLLRLPSVNNLSHRWSWRKQQCWKNSVNLYRLSFITFELLILHCSFLLWRLLPSFITPEYQLNSLEEYLQLSKNKADLIYPDFHFYPAPVPTWPPANEGDYTCNGRSCPPVDQLMTTWSATTSKATRVSPGCLTWNLFSVYRQAVMGVCFREI